MDPPLMVFFHLENVLVIVIVLSCALWMLYAAYIELSERNEIVQAMVVAGEGKYLVTGGFDKKLKLWTVEKWQGMK